MSELRLEDVWNLIWIGVLLFVGYAILRLTYEYRMPIRLLIRALWRRFFQVGDWRAAMDRLADIEQRHGTLMSREDDWGSGSEGAETGTAIGSEDWFYGSRTAPVQEKKEVSFADVIAFLVDHNLSDEEAIDLFAVAKRKSGYIVSANKIRDHIGGSDAEIKARVRSRRPQAAPIAPAPKHPPVASPIANRPIPAGVRYPEEPELEYQPPR
jgi:hypothetical protein